MDERLRKILGFLREKYPVVKCALEHNSAFELLTATILSAQCTDVQVNKVTPELFAKYSTPEKMAGAAIFDLERIIHSTGFYHNKATHLKKAATRITEYYGGLVPDSMQDLISLAGVARKTANVVLGDWFKDPQGVVVDTHVKRISVLLGLTSENSPEKIEGDLMEMLPKKEWVAFSHRLILLGREICVARRPRCKECPLKGVCPSAKL